MSSIKRSAEDANLSLDSHSDSGDSVDAMMSEMVCALPNCALLYFGPCDVCNEEFCEEHLVTHNNCNPVPTTIEPRYVEYFNNTPFLLDQLMINH